MNWSLCIIKNYFFFYIHLGYSFNSILMSHIFTNPWGGIPPPGRDIVGKNQSTWRHCHCLWSIPSDVLMQSTLGMALGMWLQLAVFSILLKSTLIVPTLSQSPLCNTEFFSHLDLIIYFVINMQFIEYKISLIKLNWT